MVMSLPARVSDLMPFDLLLSVARLGSLGLAAAEHGISQPAASTRIRRLERQLGVPLIERSPRGSHLTPDGELVAGWAQAAVDAAAALDAGVTSLRAHSDAVLRVAASMTVAEYLLPGWLTALRSRDPRTAVALTAGNSAEVASAVLGDGADIGFVEGPDLPPGLESRQVGTDRLTVVVPPGHHVVADDGSGAQHRTDRGAGQGGGPGDGQYSSACGSRASRRRIVSPADGRAVRPRDRAGLVVQVTQDDHGFLLPWQAGDQVRDLLTGQDGVGLIRGGLVQGGHVACRLCPPPSRLAAIRQVRRHHHPPHVGGRVIRHRDPPPVDSCLDQSVGKDVFSEVPVARQRGGKADESVQLGVDELIEGHRALSLLTRRPARRPLL
jgi:DNA-binding transcriptional LysR family regulator